jgi:hypothetical protein
VISLVVISPLAKGLTFIYAARSPLDSTLCGSLYSMPKPGPNLMRRIPGVILVPPHYR